MCSTTARKKANSTVGETYYKVTRADGSLYYGVDTSWHLPKNGKPGKWMPEIEGDLVACNNGYHLCTRDTLVEWLGECVWVVEPREVVELDEKHLTRQARLVRKLETWNDRTARLFACDCAERVLPIFENYYPKDNRPRKAIEVARQFADGKASEEELRAARAAARAAAGPAWAAWAAWAAEAETLKECAIIVRKHLPMLEPV